MMNGSSLYDELGKKRGDSPELETCVRRTVEQLLKQETTARRPGMLLGKIQSGKTRAFLGIIALAFDQGFEGAVVLTKGTKTLAKQTVQRILADFGSAHEAGKVGVYDIMSLPNLTPWEINRQRPIFVAKKQAANMRRLLELFGSKRPELSEKRILIVDDEADLASVRFVKKKGEDEVEQGRIAEQIDDLRRMLSQGAFLQVTATPYSLYLQPDEYEMPAGANFTFEPKRPAFTELLPVHPNYVGGNEYFGDHNESDPEFYFWHVVSEDELLALRKEDRRRVKEHEILTTGKIDALRHALISFVTAAAIRRLQQEQQDQKQRNYALIIHVETARHSHAWQHQVVGELIQALEAAVKNGDPVFDSMFNRSISDLERSVRAAGLPMPNRSEISRAVGEAFALGAVVTEKVNSDNDVNALLDAKAELMLRTPYNVFIGGQILDRGITVPNLIGFYYGRSPKRMQQDTVLQHSRMYGARDRADLAVTRFYTTPANHTALCTIHEIDSALRHAFEVNAHDRGVAFVTKDALNRIIPCAPSKVLLSEIKGVRPGGRWLPVGFQSRAKSHIAHIIDELDELIPAAAKDNDRPIKVKLEAAIGVLDLIEETLVFDEIGYSFDWKAFKAAVEYYARIVAPQPDTDHCFVLAVTDRSITRIREGGRFSDAPDTKQQAQLANSVGKSLPVLVLLRQNGLKEQGWGGYPFWWPVLFAPTLARPSIFAASALDD